MPKTNAIDRRRTAHRFGHFEPYSNDPGSPGFRLIESLGHPEVYPAGIELLQQGSSVADVFLIAKGLVKLNHFDEDGREAIVGLRATGWVLGSAAVILRKPCPFTATTLTRSSLLRLPAARFRRLLASNTHSVRPSRLERYL